MTGNGKSESPFKDICSRVRSCTHGASYRRLADLTGSNPETARRYMLNGRPSLEFVYALCESLDINANWLLFGLGPVHKRDLTANVVISFGPETVRSLAGAGGLHLTDERGCTKVRATPLSLLGQIAQAP